MSTFRTTRWQSSLNHPGTCAHCGHPLGMHAAHNSACPTRRLTRAEKQTARDTYSPKEKS